MVRLKISESVSFSDRRPGLVFLVDPQVKYYTAVSSGSGPRIVTPLAVARVVVMLALIAATSAGEADQIGVMKGGGLEKSISST